MGAPGWIVDVAEADFERDVIERSFQLPVVVDFWAEWCGPCRSLTPLLERITDEHAGRFLLAKVDVDRAQGIAGSFGIRSIPTVLGFRDGVVRSQFVGAQPEGAIHEFLRAVLPGPADEKVEEALAAVAAGDTDAAEAGLRAALELDGRHGRALLELARLLAERDEAAAALDLLDRILPHEPAFDDAERLAAELRLRGQGAVDLPALRARVDDAPDDLAARIALGRGLAATGESEEALAVFLSAVRHDPGFEDGAARKAMLDLFEVLGGDHPATQRFRSELAKALFR